MNQLWHLLGAAFSIICLLAGFKGWQFRRERRRFIKQEIDLDWVKQLSWREFEKSVAEVYEQRGFCLQHVGGGGADGGVDIKLVRNDQTTIVQCKHWRTWKIGVKPIRELYGVMTAERADAAIFVATGRYTGAAIDFAKGKPIELLGRDEFIELVRHFQKQLRGERNPQIISSAIESSTSDRDDASRSPATAHVCPFCTSEMVLRTAKRGPSSGSQFWGCTNFPRCKGTRGIK